MDIFDVIQIIIRNTGIHLKDLVDQDEWRIAQGNKRQASGYDSHVRVVVVVISHIFSVLVANPKNYFTQSSPIPLLVVC